ncbi:MAG: PPC domain-containing protein [Myxococcota bacterium]
MQSAKKPVQRCLVFLIAAAPLSACFTEETDEFEPNDTLAEATPFPSNSGVLTGRIDADGDIDYFSFSLETPAGVRIFTEGVSDECSLDTTLDLKDSDGDVIEFDDDGGTGLCSRIERVLFDGVYFIRVRSVFEDPGDYTLHLAVDGSETEPQ